MNTIFVTRCVNKYMHWIETKRKFKCKLHVFRIIIETYVVDCCYTCSVCMCPIFFHYQNGHESPYTIHCFPSYTDKNVFIFKLLLRKTPHNGRQQLFLPSIIIIPLFINVQHKILYSCSTLRTRFKIVLPTKI